MRSVAKHAFVHYDALFIHFPKVSLLLEQRSWHELHDFTTNSTFHEISWIITSSFLLLSRLANQFLKRHRPVYFHENETVTKEKMLRIPTKTHFVIRHTQREHAQTFKRSLLEERFFLWIFKCYTCSEANTSTKFLIFFEATWGLQAMTSQTKKNNKKKQTKKTATGSWF